MVFQLDFKGLFHNIKIHLKRLLYYICTVYFYILATLQSEKVRRSEIILGWKNVFFTFSERDFSALKSLNY